MRVVHNNGVVLHVVGEHGVGFDDFNGSSDWFPLERFSSDFDVNHLLIFIGGLY